METIIVLHDISPTKVNNAYRAIVRAARKDVRIRSPRYPVYPYKKHILS